MSEMQLDQLFSFPGLSDRIAGVVDAINDAIQTGPASLSEPCLRQITAGGKRLRPALVIATANLLADPATSTVDDGAAAVELIHTGSLIHDDIIDVGEKRRHQETINIREGNDVALLAGDFVMGLAGEAATRASQRIGAELSRTIVALCKGQMAETETLYRLDRTHEQYTTALEGKTAALLAACCTIGVLSVAPDDQDSLEAFGRFGYHFGMAFQIIDDVVDAIGIYEDTGKQTGKDVLAGVLTLPFLIARDAGDPTITEPLEQLWQAARKYDALPDHERLKKLSDDKEIGAEMDEASVRELIETLQQSPHVEAAIEQAEAHNRKAREAIAPIRPRDASTECFDAYRALPTNYAQNRLALYRLIEKTIHTKRNSQ